MNDPLAPQAENLRLLSIFHWIWAALGVFGLAFLVLHYSFMFGFLNPQVMAKADKPPPPQFYEMMGLFRWMYLAFALYGVTTMVLNVLAALWLRARRNWLFCMVLSAINCVSFPLGTILGVFTIVVLCKEQVRETFG